MAINETAKLIITLLIGAALWFGIQTILEWREGAQKSQQQTRTAQATSGILADGAKADENRGVVDAAINEGKSKFNNDYSEAKRHDPEIADRADRAVPDRVRESYRARRLARERSGCIGGECEARPADAGSRQR